MEVRQHAPWRTALAGDGADDCSCWVDAYSLPLLALYDPAPVHALLVTLEPVHPLAAVWPRLLTFRQLDESRKPPESIYKGLVVQASVSLRVRGGVYGGVGILGVYRVRVVG